MRHARQTEASAEASKAISSGCDPDRLRWFMIAAAALVPLDAERR
jgi:hypothetical protein